MLLYISLIYCQGQIPGRSQHIRLFAPINIQIGLQGFVIFLLESSVIFQFPTEKNKNKPICQKEKTIFFRKFCSDTHRKTKQEKRKYKIIHS